MLNNGRFETRGRGLDISSKHVIKQFANSLLSTLYDGTIKLHDKTQKTDH